MRERQGQVWRALRERKGLTQQALADELGVHREALSQIERGVRAMPDEPREDEVDRKLGRPWTEEVLALGPKRAGSEMAYTVAILGEDGKLRVEEPVAWIERHDVADAIAALLWAVGSPLVVVPAWSSFVERRGLERLDDAAAVGRFLMEATQETDRSAV